MTAVNDALLERIGHLAGQRDAPATLLADRPIQEDKPLSFVDLSAKETRKYSLSRAISLTLPAAGKRLNCLELEASQEQERRLESLSSDHPLCRQGHAHGGSILIPYEIQTRAMATQPGSKGGYAVGVENVGFVDAVRARSVVVRMGARTLSGLTANMTMPRVTSSVTVTWQGADGSSVSATDQALGSLSMTPRSCIAITDVSEQLLRQTGPAVDSFIARDLGAAVGVAVDNAAINGAGGAQPAGIINTPGVTTGQDSATATWAKLLAFSQAAGTANALRGNPGFIANTAGAAALMQKQQFSGTDSPLWKGSILDGLVTGLPAMSSEQVASGNLLFGSWDELVIGDWGVLEISASNGGGTRFNNATVGIRAMWMVDIMLRYPQAFIVSSNLS